MTKVTIQPRRARPFFARHPWVFAGSIARVDGPAEAGQEVTVVSHENQFIARGLFNPQSAIRVRLYRWDDAPLDEAFWRARIDAAVALRCETLNLDGPQSACRIVSSEADGISGLTVDRYDRWLVAQITSLALYERRDLLIRLLVERTSALGVILRVDRAIAEQEGLPSADGLVWGAEPDGPITIIEHGLTYEVDPRSGQKTGFYLDQRDNRLAASKFAQNQRVLDLFCYTGGFALNALKNGGASHAIGFDSSSAAIETARKNAVANGLGTARFETADVFEALGKLRERGEKFGLVICDPPKFARTPRHLEDAMKGYLRLNRMAVDVLAPGGILVTCSCSGHVDRPMFASMLGQVAELAGRPIRILEQRGQAADHPISSACLETDYLKCFICHAS